MHWKRRRPKWPFLAALVCLFAVTLVAPWSWRQARSKRAESARLSATDATQAPILVAAHQPSQPAETWTLAPALPPLAVPGGAEPTLAAPMVIADDYVAVEEPLPALEAPLLPAAEPQPPAATELVATTPTVEGSLPLAPPSRSVVVRNVPAPPPAAPSMFSVASLAKVREAITQAMEAVEQTRQAEASALATAAAPRLPRVVVQSETDRLAMIPPRSTPLPMQSLPVADVAVPPAAARSALRCRPAALVAQLEDLANNSPASPWAREVLSRIDALTTAPAGADPVGPATVADLRLLAERGFSEALTVADPSHQTSWIRACRSLDRRLAVWTLLVDQAFMDRHAAGTAWPSDHGALMHALHEVASLTAGPDAGAAWRQYLRLDDLAGLSSVGGEEFVESRRAAARDVLTRMTNPWLTAEQREFLTQPPIVALAQQLRGWAGGEVSLDALAALIERYESTGSLRDADAIAELRMRMNWSTDPRLQALAVDLNRNYRNANMRIALSSELINRWIPPQEPVNAPVRNRIAGADVRGRSQTETDLTVRLLPDPTVWRLGLEAHGQVTSRTLSQTWPAKLRNSSHMEYEARKLVLVNRFGLHVFPAEARAEGDTRLLGIESQLSAIPILGSIVDNAAREQHRKSRPRAVAQVEAKVGQEARERMDREADAKLATLRQRFSDNVLEPLDRFALPAEPVDMNTTEERATMRLRLAREQQLAAHTPRPSAPSDSLASFQLHESVFNNAIRGLELDGRRISVGELHGILSQKIRRHAAAPPADLPRAAKVEFAPHDAIRVACHADQIELILHIVELRHGRDSIRGVRVHAFFRPVVDGMEVKLVREGTLQFDGAHLRTGPRMVLHSVFGKLLPKDQEVPVLAGPVGADPRLAGLMVTQLVIDDGWLALSVGPATPQRTAWRTRGIQTK